jgi:N-acetylneuraminic acid mutarotase
MLLVYLHGAVYLYGGGQATSSPAIVRVDPKTGAAHDVGNLGEPLSDLGTAVVNGTAYLVGGYTGSRYATAVLRIRGTRATVAARLPEGLRYAGVAAIGNTIYVAGGVTTSGETSAVQAVNPATGSVRQIGTLPRPIAHAPLVAAHGALYLIGGRAPNGAALRTILRIDPRSGVVTRLGGLPQALADSAAVTVGSRVILLGGGASSPSNAVYEFTP